MLAKLKSYLHKNRIPFKVIRKGKDLVIINSQYLAKSMDKKLSLNEFLKENGFRRWGEFINGDSYWMISSVSRKHSKSMQA
jgi:hypothetical protein